MTFETIRVETDARGIATVTLNRPELRNAINASMMHELTEIAHILDNDDAVRVIVIAGAGKVFSAGGDFNWMREQLDKDRAGKKHAARMLMGMFGAWNGLSKPVVGRAHGAAFGGGLALISICDVAVASDDTRFAMSETYLGLIPATITPFIVRQIGEGFARQISLNSKPFGTDLALRSGLITRTCTVEELDAAVEGECVAFLECAPGAIAEAKSLCLKLGGTDPMETVEMVVEALANRWESEEARAGIAAFLTKQTPPWRVN